MPYVPLNWLAEHVALPAGTTAETLAAALVRVGLEEEAIHPPAVTGPLVVGRVLTQVRETHKNGKTISYNRVDVGPHNDAPGTGAETSDLPSRGIVCGAPNLEVGDTVVVSLPGSVLPGPFPIAARKTYGHVSDGMICSERELGLGEDHDGIIRLQEYLGLDADDADDAAALPAPGTDAAALLGLGEEVLEINVTPDRGYCFSMRGVAREYAHSTGAAFTDPGLPGNLPAGPPPPATDDGFPVEVRDDAPIHGVPGCDRFVTRIVRGVDPAAPSPDWMTKRLRAAGMRPISLAVDITNYVMLDLGQPLHAYDLHQVAAPIVVRRAAPGERLTTLDDADRALDPGDLLITDSPDSADGAPGTRVLGLAGVMGGASSEITSATTDVLVEAAHFDPVTVARTARRHKLPSEAAKRFERGVDPQLAPVAAQRVVDLLVRYGGGTADPAVFDLDTTQPPAALPFDPGAAARLVGVDYAPQRVRELLEEIGCTVETGAPAEGTSGAADHANWLVTPPTWRPDLAGSAHFVEEVARLDGYDAIPTALPAPPGGLGLTTDQRRRRDIERTVAEHGLVQVLSYPFVAPEISDRLGLPADDARRDALRLVNPLADGQPLMRTSLLASLLDTARRNVSRASGTLAIFETGMVTRPAGRAAATTPSAAGRPSDEQLAALHRAVPHQPRRLAAVLAGPRTEATAWGAARAQDWADAIEVARVAARVVGLEVHARADAHAPWHPGRSAALSVPGQDGEVLIGHAGELHPRVVAEFDLPARAAAVEIDLDALLAAASPDPVEVRPVSTFPAAKEDVALVVDAAVPAADVEAAVREGAGELAEEVRLFDVYTGAPLAPGEKSLAYALKLRAPDRTLTAADAEAVRQGVVEAAARRVGATLRA